MCGRVNAGAIVKFPASVTQAGGDESGETRVVIERLGHGPIQSRAPVPHPRAEQKAKL